MGKMAGHFGREKRRRRVEHLQSLYQEQVRLPRPANSRLSALACRSPAVNSIRNSSAVTSHVKLPGWEQVHFHKTMPVSTTCPIKLLTPSNSYRSM